MQRSIDLQGCYNFRDLGGYPTEDGRSVGWRRVYRSDGLHHLSAADIATLRDLGLGEIVDLRSTNELTADGRGPLEAEAIAFHHLPLFDGQTNRRPDPAFDEATATLADRYFFLADFAQEAIARVLSILADASTPVVYHCAAGKDRTGVVSAVLLGILGVRDEIIVADYAASRDNLDSIIERLMSTEGYQTMLSALPPDTMHAEPATMESFLERMRDRFGSMEGYAVAAGMSAGDVGRLRDRLLE